MNSRIRSLTDSPGSLARVSPPAVLVVLVLAALAVAAAGCGGDVADEQTIPTDEEVASSLLRTTDFDGEWTILSPPEWADAATSGVVPDALRDMLPRLELCDRADPDALAAADDLAWMAFRQLDLAVDDPIEPPGDVTGPTESAGHMVFVQEFLVSDEPDEIEATFELLRDGMAACLGDIPAGEEGPGSVATMTIPEVGDDRYGTLTLVEEAGGGAEWRLHGALVRQGPVLMSLVIVDIRAGDVEPYSSDAEIAGIIQTAADRL